MILAPPRPGAAAPLDPGWGRLRPQTPEKLRCGRVKWKGCGLLPGCKAREGCFSKGCEWLGLGNRLRRFPKGFWGMVGYGGERVGERVRGIGNRSGTGGAAGKDGPGGRRRPQRPGGGGGGAERPQRRGQGPWPPAAPLVLGPGFARPQNAAAPRGVAERGRKGASTPHFDALALQFFGKMGTITRRINL